MPTPITLTVTVVVAVERPAALTTPTISAASSSSGMNARLIVDTPSPHEQTTLDAISIICQTS